MFVFCAAFYIFLFFDASTSLSKPTPEVKQTNKICNNGAGMNLQIGLRRNYSYFQPKIEVCFKPNKPHQTFWTKHIIDDPDDDFLCPEKSKSYSWKTDFFLENPQEFYLNNKGYHKGHLAPQCDFWSADEKQMTFFYINAAPQLRNLNQGSWKKLENAVRKKKVPIFTVTGTIGSLNKRNLDLVNIPKYFFKIVFANDIFNNRTVYVGKNFRNNESERLCKPLERCELFSDREISKDIYCCFLDEKVMKALGLKEEDLRNYY